MSLRPGVLCKLEKGKLIDAQGGFVDTFNWMVDFISNLKAEQPLSLDTKLSDKPVLKFDFSSGNRVVTELEYDTSSHELKVTTKEATIEFVEGSEKEETVFTAMPHSEDQ